MYKIKETDTVLLLIHIINYLHPPYCPWQITHTHTWGTGTHMAHYAPIFFISFVPFLNNGIPTKATDNK